MENRIQVSPPAMQDRDISKGSFSAASGCFSDIVPGPSVAVSLPLPWTLPTHRGVRAFGTHAHNAVGTVHLAKLRIKGGSRGVHGKETFKICNPHPGTYLTSGRPCRTFSWASRCLRLCLHSFLAGQAADDVGVAWVGDGQAAHPVVAAAGGAQLVVVAMEVVHPGLRQHGVVLDLTLAQGGAIVGDQHQLGLPLEAG